MNSSDSNPRAGVAVYVGVFLVALSIILFQIALTRVFAILMWHHLTYMVISIALLGFGAAGSFMTARGDVHSTAKPEPRLARYAILYGFSVMAALCFATCVRVDSLSLWQEKRNFFALLLLYLILIGPFLFGGLCIGTGLTRYAREVNRIYFADLIGSAVGGAFSAMLLSRLGAPATIMLAGAAGVLGGSCFAAAAGFGRALRSLVPLTAAAAIAVAFCGGSETLRIPAATWDIPFAPNKEVKEFTDDLMAARIPSATAEVEVSVPFTAFPAMGGDFGSQDRQEVEMRTVAQDGTAPTVLFKDAGDLARFPFLDDNSACTAYQVIASREEAAATENAHGNTTGSAAEKDVLVIGVGGGVDVMVALHHGATHVDAVEINTAMIEMVTERFDVYAGGLFRPGAWPYSDKIALWNGEGRSFMRHQDRKYDVIQMSGVDSFTALSTGAYTLSESYLYTVEAVREFYDHLKDGGVINYSRFILTYPKKPRETLRLANIAYTALDELGVPDPWRHVAVFQGLGWASTMIKKGPFTPTETAWLQAFAERQGFHGLVFDPTVDRQAAALPGFIRSAARSRITAQFEAAGMLDPEVADKLVVDASIEHALHGLEHKVRGDAAAAEMSVDAALAHLPAETAAHLRPGFVGLLDTAAIPARARATAHASTQREFTSLLRATDAERAAFVAAYPFDISPCTDDRPFFFNYYRYEGLLRGEDQDTLGDQSHYHHDYPVGHAVLLFSAAQIIAVAFLLILYPLRRLRARGEKTTQRLRWFTYFAALGLGFMFVEIVLMQKMVIFLGHPTYAISVVLTALLGFAGLGAFLSGRLPAPTGMTVIKLAAAVVAAIFLATLSVNYLLPQLIGTSFHFRVIASVLTLLPIGVLLGVPFPWGIRALKEQAPALIPWAWAINGFLSVLSSVLCIVLSMAIGFTAVLGVAAVVYAIGLLCMPTVRAGSAVQTPIQVD